MIEVFNEKVIICGKHIEHYQYLTKPVLRGYRRRKRLPKKINKERIMTKEKSESSVNRTRTEIRRLVNSNPKLNKFLTLTFGYEMTDLKKSNQLFNSYIRKMNKHFPEFKYVAIVEFQKDFDYQGNFKKNGGSIHYHLLCNLRFVKSEKLEKIWKHGFIKIKRINRVNNIGAYVCKYLHKEMFDKRMFRKKKFFRSQDLDKPAEIVGNNAKFFMEEGKENLKLVWEKEFEENEHRGKVLYKQYKYRN